MMYVRQAIVWGVKRLNVFKPLPKINPTSNLSYKIICVFACAMHNVYAQCGYLRMIVAICIRFLPKVGHLRGEKNDAGSCALCRVLFFANHSYSQYPDSVKRPRARQSPWTTTAACTRGSIRVTLQIEGIPLRGSNPAPGVRCSAFPSAFVCFLRAQWNLPLPIAFNQKPVLCKGFTHFRPAPKAIVSVCVMAQAPPYILLCPSSRLVSPPEAGTSTMLSFLSHLVGGNPDGQGPGA